MATLEDNANYKGYSRSMQYFLAKFLKTGLHGHPRRDCRATGTDGSKAKGPYQISSTVLIGIKMARATVSGKLPLPSAEHPPPHEYIAFGS